MRHAARTDDCQQSIVDALRRAGIGVYIVGLPLDLLCSVRVPGQTSSRTLLLEVKDDDGRLTKAQSEFMANWIGEYHIVRSPSEALRACLGKAMR